MPNQQKAIVIVLSTIDFCLIHKTIDFYLIHKVRILSFSSLLALRKQIVICNILFLGELLLLVSIPIIVLELSNNYEIIECINPYNTLLENWYSGIFMEQAKYTDL